MIYQFGMILKKTTISVPLKTILIASKVFKGVRAI